MAYVKHNGLTIGKGNLKLDASIGIWNISAVKTCPNCSTCASTCYALKSEKFRPVVKACRQRNWDLSKLETFVEDMITLIKKSKVKVFRIHESGDFYSQEYADKWSAIAQALPGIQFYAYTKSPYRPCADNLNIVESVLPDGGKNYGKVEEIVPRALACNAFICPCKPGDRHKLCGSKCKVCQTAKYVAFIQH